MVSAPIEKGVFKKRKQWFMGKEHSVLERTQALKSGRSRFEF